MWLPTKTLASPTAALVLDLYQCTFRPDASSDQLQPKSDVRTPLVTKLGRPRSRGSVESITKAAPSNPLKGQVAKTSQGRRPSSSSPSHNSPSDNSPASSSNNSRTSSRASSRGSQQEATPAAAVESPKAAEQEAVVQRLVSSPNTATEVEMVALGTVSFPFRQLSDDRTGTVTELEGQLALTTAVEVGSATEQDLLVRLEVQAWTADALAAQQPQTPSWHQNSGTAEHSAHMLWLVICICISIYLSAVYSLYLLTKINIQKMCAGSRVLIGQV